MTPYTLTPSLIESSIKNSFWQVYRTAKLVSSSCKNPSLMAVCGNYVFTVLNNLIIPQREEAISLQSSKFTSDYLFGQAVYGGVLNLYDRTKEFEAGATGIFYGYNEVLEEWESGFYFVFSPWQTSIITDYGTNIKEVVMDMGGMKEYLNEFDTLYIS
jgi:hypothetical protein